jgi:hypothetical protein
MLLWLVILLNITVLCLTEEWFMLLCMNHSSVKHQTVMVNNITSHNNMNHSSVKHKTVLVNNISSHDV